MAAKKKLDETAAIVMLLETWAEPGETLLQCLKRVLRGSGKAAEAIGPKSLLEDPEKAAAFAEGQKFCKQHGRGYRGECNECAAEAK